MRQLETSDVKAELRSAVANGVAGPAALWVLGVGVLAYWAALSWSSPPKYAGYDLHCAYLAGGQLTHSGSVYSGTCFGYLPSAALLVGAPLSFRWP